jgi:hypothetical protein
MESFDLGVARKAVAGSEHHVVSVWMQLLRPGVGQLDPAARTQERNKVLGGRDVVELGPADSARALMRTPMQKDAQRDEFG